MNTIMECKIEIKEVIYIYTKQKRISYVLCTG